MGFVCFHYFPPSARVNTNSSHHPEAFFDSYVNKAIPQGLEVCLWEFVLLFSSNSPQRCSIQDSALATHLINAHIFIDLDFCSIAIDCRREQPSESDLYVQKCLKSSLWLQHLNSIIKTPYLV